MGPVEKVLREARERIRDPKRWCRGAVDARACSVCSLAAIGSASGNVHDILGADRVLSATLGRCSDEESSLLLIMDWNDAPERKHHEVIAAFGLAIARAKREGK